MSVFFLTLFLKVFKKLTCFWVAVLATTTLGRHVEINLKLIHMASGVKTHTFGRHVENRLKVDKHGSGFLFSLTVLKRKAPIELGAMLRMEA